MRVNKVNLGIFPTPLYKLNNLSKAFGHNSQELRYNSPELGHTSQKLSHNFFIKRDDLTGLGLGGNKIRKLEFLMADAIKKKADIVLTVGGTQSNHAFLTALCCKRIGLDVKLILGYTQEYETQGNLLLEKIIDTDILRVKTTDVFKLHEVMDEVARSLRKKGRRPYLIPVGGSNAVGSRGYIEAAKEVYQQMKKAGIKIDSLYCACGSGGTVAGLLVGKRMYNLPFDIIGIDVGAVKKNTVEEYILEFLNELAVELKVKKFKLKDIKIYHQYMGEKYGKTTPECLDAIRLLSKIEGIFLDPVYTAKAFAGMLDIAKRTKKKKNILFLHTGGLPALFSYNKVF